MGVDVMAVEPVRVNRTHDCRGLLASTQVAGEQIVGAADVLDRSGSLPICYRSAGEACIEIHHAKVQVSEMQSGHITSLEDLQCLCANCHRFIHRQLALTT
jgi:hypothetical protein